LTQQGFYTRTGFSTTRISEVENGKGKLSREFAERCEQALPADGALLTLFDAVVGEETAERHARLAARRRRSNAEPSSAPAVPCSEEVAAAQAPSDSTPILAPREVGSSNRRQVLRVGGTLAGLAISGKHRLVHGGLPGDDLAVHRQLLTRPDPHQVTRPDLLDGDHATVRLTLNAWRTPARRPDGWTDRTPVCCCSPSPTRPRLGAGSSSASHQGFGPTSPSIDDSMTQEEDRSCRTRTRTWFDACTRRVRQRRSGDDAGGRRPGPGVDLLGSQA